MFECLLCEYFTDRSTDLERHKKSKKHINNEQTKTVKRQDFLRRKLHNDEDSNDSSNNPTYDELYKQIKKLEDKNDQLSNKNDQLTNLLCKNTDTLSKTTELALQNSKTAGKSVRGITYAMKHLNNAHQLKLLENKEAVKLLTYDNKKSQNDTVETIIIKYKNKLLYQYLGDILVKAYKTDDPEIQSVWGVDSARLHFILKQKEWTSDNCGIKLTEIIINPLLKSVDKMIKKYCETNKPTNKTDGEIDYETNEANKSLLDKFTRKWGICQELLLDISKNKLHKQILKYISSRLKLTYDVPPKKSNNESEDNNFELSSDSDKKPKRIKINKANNIITNNKKKIIVYSDSD